jgi:hypothetical protein
MRFLRRTSDLREWRLAVEECRFQSYMVFTGKEDAPFRSLPLNFFFVLALLLTPSETSEIFSSFDSLVSFRFFFGRSLPVSAVSPAFSSAASVLSASSGREEVAVDCRYVRFRPKLVMRVITIVEGEKKKTIRSTRNTIYNLQLYVK